MSVLDRWELRLKSLLRQTPGALHGALLPLGADCTVEWQSDERRSFCLSLGYSRVPFG